MHHKHPQFAHDGRVPATEVEEVEYLVEKLTMNVENMARLAEPLHSFYGASMKCSAEEQIRRQPLLVGIFQMM